MTLQQNASRPSALVTAAILGSHTLLQMLFDADARADVNYRDLNGCPLIFYLVPTFPSSEAELRLNVVLNRPELNLDVTYDGKSIEEYARHKGFPQLAAMVGYERAQRRAVAERVMKTPCDTSRAELLQFCKYYPGGRTNGGSPLFTIARMPFSDSCIEVAAFLLMHGVDPNVVDHYGDTPVMTALLSRNDPLMKLQMLKLLIGYGADVDIANKRGITALHYAFNSTNLRRAIFAADARSVTQFWSRIDVAKALLHAMDKDFEADPAYAKQFADERAAIIDDITTFEHALIGRH